MIPWPHPAFIEAASLILQAFILPIQTAAIILFYYDLRVRKEAFDLQRLAESVSQASAPTPVG